MEKTNDEVKAGLECCQNQQSCTEFEEPKCPYNDVKECVDTLLADALALIQHLEAQVPRWISVEESLPEEGQLVLFIPTCNTNSVYVGKLSHVGGRGSIMFENRNAKAKTKYYSRWWMPLPESPEE